METEEFYKLELSEGVNSQEILVRTGSTPIGVEFFKDDLVLKTKSVTDEPAYVKWTVHFNTDGEPMNVIDGDKYKTLNTFEFPEKYMLRAFVKFESM